MQEQDPNLQTVQQWVLKTPVDRDPEPLLDDSRELQTFHCDLPDIRLERDLLVYTQGGQGPMLSHANDTPIGGHRSYKAILKTLQQVAYWPFMACDTNLSI